RAIPLYGDIGYPQLPAHNGKQPARLLGFKRARIEGGLNEVFKIVRFDGDNVVDIRHGLEHVRRKMFNVQVSDREAAIAIERARQRTETVSAALKLPTERQGAIKGSAGRLGQDTVQC